MCTAITYQTRQLYFGRTLDYECSYGEQVTITPRNYPFDFHHAGPVHTHYAIIGMAHVAGGYPLYYDAVNETGLCMAGLNFVGNAVYAQPEPDRTNIAQFELIPWLLGRCASVQQARTELSRLNLTGTPFSAALPAAQLHWLIADEREAVTVESTADGLHVYENPIGVLTNNPPFGEQLFNLNNYMHLSPRQPENRFSQALPLRPYSRGMGALGLPGDLSSMSRFVRAAFTKLNAVSDDTEQGSVSQFSTSSAPWSSSAAAARWQTGSTSARSIPPAAMHTAASIIIPPMITAASQQSICTGKISTAVRLLPIRL